MPTCFTGISSWNHLFLTNIAAAVFAANLQQMPTCFTGNSSWNHLFLTNITAADFAANLQLKGLRA